MKTATQTSVPLVAAPATNPHVRLLDAFVLVKMGQPAQATITLDIAGKHVTRQVAVRGGVNAIAEAIRELTDHDAKFKGFHVDNVGEGSAARAHVRVEYIFNGILIPGDGEDEDTLIASAIAMINAINQTYCAGTAPAH